MRDLVCIVTVVNCQLVFFEVVTALLTLVILDRDCKTTALQFTCDITWVCVVIYLL